VTLNAITTGGTAGAYRPEGRNRFTMRQLLAPFDQTAHLCGMRFLAPFVVHGALALSGDTPVAPHARRYVRLLESLRDGTLDLARAAAAEELGALLDERSAERVETGA
jgi:glutathione-regulated potassium-efflux system ancillary protein KefG